MSSSNTNQSNSASFESKPLTATELAEKLSEQTTKGLSQPPSRSQVPPATAAEEIIE